MILEKAALRKKFISMLEKTTPREMAEASAVACEKLINHPQFKRAQIIFCYVATAHEISPAAAVKEALEQGKRVAYPVVIGGGKMLAAEPHQFGEWKKGALGIWEPTLQESEVIAPEAIDLAIVPGLAFDTAGARLGRGAGYYDRYLKATNAFKLGFALRVQLTQLLPCDENDVRMDAVITP